MASLNEIRTHFLDYFQRKDHAVVASAPLVPQNDPTLLFVNAGMVPFKNYFTGAETSPWPRAASSQKSVRAGGKHNDLDNVGYTARHHTFFEMLGNFSFGDYFKEGAIEYAWELLTKEFELPVDKLLVTVYADDDEAPGLWKKIAGLPDEQDHPHRHRRQLLVHGRHRPLRPLLGDLLRPRQPHPRRPARQPGRGRRPVRGDLEPGLHAVRAAAPTASAPACPSPPSTPAWAWSAIAAVLQGVHDNYDIDLFRAIIAASRDLVGGAGGASNGPSHRVIADHLRSSSFLIADGVTPSNEGRGYVLRRIMRRAMRHAHLLGAADPLMHRLAPDPGEQMGEAYPELKRAEPAIVDTLRQEEERFRRTLGRGMSLLDEATGGPERGRRALRRDRVQALRHLRLPARPDPGRGARQGPDRRPRRASTRPWPASASMAREAWTGSGQVAAAGGMVRHPRPAGPHGVRGLRGRPRPPAELLVLVEDGREIDGAAAGAKVQAVFDRTPFYAESGGQAGDQGEVEWEGGTARRVTDVQKQAGDLFVHDLEILEGALAPGARVRLAVDAERRAQTRANHSATHLLHAALRNVLGPHVTQKGQMVDGERIRFDFSHGAPVTPDEIDRIEAEVNAVVRQNLPAETQLMAPKEAMAAGAMALFGEKYGETVRVLTLGRALSGRGRLFGGALRRHPRGAHRRHRPLQGRPGAGRGRRRAPHRGADRRGGAALAAGPGGGRQGPGRPVQGSGVRGPGPRRRAGGPAPPAGEGAGRRQAPARHGRRRRRRAPAGPEEIGGVQVMARVMDGVGGKDLRPIAEEFKKQLPDGVIALVGTADGKAAVTVAVTGAAQAPFNAVELAKAAVLAMGGQGAGGRPDFAQGGAPDGAKAAEGLAAIKAALWPDDRRRRAAPGAAPRRCWPWARAGRAAAQRRQASPWRSTSWRGRT